MKRLVLFFFLLQASYSNSQIHNRVLKFNSGISTEQLDHKNLITAINDTSQVHNFEFVSWSPTFAFSHEFVVNGVLSFSYTLGGQYMNIFYNNQHFGSPFIFASVNPQVSLFYRKGFEYYIKLKAGLTVWFHDTDLIDDQMRRHFPDKVNMFTGVTLGGFNYFLSDHWGLNLELSIWSPELVNFGVTYRFYKGTLPTIQESRETDEL